MNAKRVRIFVLACLAAAAAVTSIHAARTTWFESPADVSRPSVGGDPVEEFAKRETLSAQPELRTRPAPYQRVRIPEPRENARLLGLNEQPPDNDPPVSAGMPPRPVLQLSAPPKK